MNNNTVIGVHEIRLFSNAFSASMTSRGPRHDLGSIQPDWLVHFSRLKNPPCCEKIEVSHFRTVHASSHSQYNIIKMDSELFT